MVTQRIETLRQEWRAFSKEEYEGRSRAGIPTSLAMHDMGLSTIIGRAKSDASGKRLSTSMYSTMKRLRTWDGRSQFHEPVDRNLREAFKMLKTLADKLALSDYVIEKAAYIYRKAIERNLVRGRSISALIGAALYASCRDAETPRTLKDLADTSNVKRKDLSRSYRLLIKELDLKIPVFDPVKCIARIGSKLGISEKTKRKAIEILRRAEEARISAGKAPMGLAATTLYVACVANGENVTQKDVAEAAGVTEVTIRNRCKSLKITLNIKI